MADFSAWGPVELKVTLGEILTALSAAAAAWWVGHVIQRRDANERAIKNTLASLCRDSLVTLNALSESIEANCPRGGVAVEEAVRHKFMRGLTMFSNSVLTIDVAYNQSGLVSGDAFAELKSAREALRPQITDPLVVADGRFDDIQLR